MNKIIKQIHLEHQNISTVLHILEKEIAIFDKGEDTNFNLIQDIINYMADYPDKVHHPNEELILSLLLEIEQTSQEDVLQFQQEHRELSELTIQFVETIEEIVLECVLPREQVSKLAHQFIKKNRNHMQMEETKLLPRAMKVFKDTDWMKIEAQIPEKNDPLFGQKRAKQYQALYDNIVKYQ